MKALAYPARAQFPLAENVPESLALDKSTNDFYWSTQGMWVLVTDIRFVANVQQEVIMDRITDSEKNETDKRIEALEKQVQQLSSSCKELTRWRTAFVAFAFPIVMFCVLLVAGQIRQNRLRLDEKDSEIKTLISGQVENEAEIRTIGRIVNMHDHELESQNSIIWRLLSTEQQK